MSTGPDVKAIFLQAIEMEAAQERRKYLDEACGDDSATRRRVEELLTSFDEADSFMEKRPGAASAPTEAQSHIAEEAGTVIGPYKLLQQIGEGGMGVVYMAQQTEPVRRRVALKIIKPGMDTKQVVARFEAERQALAMMDHPNIAKVLDAGATESGRPYFVMELMKGTPITKFCNDHHLSPQQRLVLFTDVCNAVQHAHQKGVIHRDLKPSNVLVAHFDDKPVIKVIDFGVAKSIGQQLTDKTYFTRFDQVVGTLEYMSPEQIRFNQRDIDTRSDIYSLGVLLYELLTGSTPFERNRLQTAAIDELVRIISDEEPPKPSSFDVIWRERCCCLARKKEQRHSAGSGCRNTADYATRAMTLALSDTRTFFCPLLPENTSSARATARPTCWQIFLNTTPEGCWRFPRTTEQKPFGSSRSVNGRGMLRETLYGPGYLLIDLRKTPVGHEQSRATSRIFRRLLEPVDNGSRIGKSKWGVFRTTLWMMPNQGGILILMSNVTQILSQIESGDPSAAHQLLPLVYEELQKLTSSHGCPAARGSRVLN